MNRCLNNFWGYCDTEPKIKMVDEERVVYDLGGRSYIEHISMPRCKLSLATCGHYAHFTGIIAEQLNSAKAYSSPSKGA